MLLDDSKPFDAPTFLDDPGFFDHAALRLHSRFRDLLTARPDAVLCGVSAAHLMGLPVPPPLVRGPIHVASPAEIRRTGFRAHRTERIDVRDVDGLPVNAPERVVAECAAMLTEDDLVVLLDAAMSAQKSARVVDAHHSVLHRAEPGMRPEQGVRPVLVPPDRLVPFLRGEATARMHGRKKLLRALDRARGDVRSPRLSRLRIALGHAGLPDPEVRPRVDLPGLAGSPEADGLDLPEHIRPDLLYRDAQVMVGLDPAQVGAETAGRLGGGDPCVTHHVYARRLHDEGWSVVPLTRATELAMAAASVRRLVIHHALARRAA
ncbi:hypothetical protein [Brevibacterium litoralis]|uniref:hypothetical protein n=1 Tax=Brevibacterium litoralis TaxID=3138935 RepID=UPI0032EAD032